MILALSVAKVRNLFVILRLEAKKLQKSAFLAVDTGAGRAEGALADAHDAQDVFIALALML